MTTSIPLHMFFRCYQPNYYAITFGVLQGIFSYLRHILLP